MDTFGLLPGGTNLSMLVKGTDRREYGYIWSMNQQVRDEVLEGVDLG